MFDSHLQRKEKERKEFTFYLEFMFKVHFQSSDTTVVWIRQSEIKNEFKTIYLSKASKETGIKKDIIAFISTFNSFCFINMHA